MVYAYCVCVCPSLQPRIDLGLPNDMHPDSPIICFGLPQADTPSQVFFHVVLPSFSWPASSTCPFIILLSEELWLSILSTCPIQLILLDFINRTISSCFRMESISLLVPILYSSLQHTCLLYTSRCV